MLLCATACAHWARIAQAGGGPENVFLVVNSHSWSSQTIANHFCDLRSIPASNVFCLDWKGMNTWMTVDVFRRRILGPVLQEIDKRQLGPQIDYVVYSSDFPYEIRFGDDLPHPDRLASGSITGMTYLAQLVQAKDPRYAQNVNWYMRVPKPNTQGQTAVDGTIELPTRGFRSQFLWGPGGELVPRGGQQYLLSSILGYTSGLGNSVEEVIGYLRRSALADASRPHGTVYFLLAPDAEARLGSSARYDIRSAIRQPAFSAAADQLRALGIGAEIVDGHVLPQNRSDVVGLMAGSPQFDWLASRSTILPGAICENLTSYGAVFDAEETARSQTRLSPFLRYGAAGSSGTVVEPSAAWVKFPHPMIHVHYARGSTLAEAFYQSIYTPYQLLIVGDPLCRPWGTIPRVMLDGLAPGQGVSGRVVLRPRAQTAPGTAIDHFQLFVDGRRVDQCPAEGQFELDTLSLGDGYHELRLVAVESSLIQSQGRLIIPIMVNNQQGQLQWSTDPSESVAWDKLITASAASDGAQEIVFVHGRRIVGRIAGERGQVRIDPSDLGYGPITLQAVALRGEDPREHVFGQPIRLRVNRPRPLPAAGSVTRFAQFQNLRVTSRNGKTVPLGKTTDRNWPAGAGLALHQPWEISGDIIAPQDDVYQLELEYAGDCEVRVDDLRMFRQSSDTNQHFYVPVALRQGKHRIWIRGSLRGTLRFFVAFGNRGTTSLASDQFKPGS
jgi:uncharacterized protein (TIGR03790 family)